MDRCGRSSRCKGHCHRHYTQLWRHGQVLPPEREYKKGSRERQCAARGCLEKCGPGGANGMCPMHYQRFRRRRTRGCKSPGCEARHHGRGLCMRHYWLSRRPNRPPVRGTCSVLGCSRPHQARGVCGVHYMRRRRMAAVSWR